MRAFMGGLTDVWRTRGISWERSRRWWLDEGMRTAGDRISIRSIVCTWMEGGSWKR